MVKQDNSRLWRRCQAVLACSRLAAFLLGLCCVSAQPEYAVHLRLWRRPAEHLHSRLDVT